MNEKAFPNPHRTDQLGMTLRDYFAARALQRSSCNLDAQQLTEPTGFDQ